MLDTRRKYLQIAYNESIAAATRGILALPKSDKIIVEVGTALIKQKGEEAIREIRNIWGGYLVADIKCMDRGGAEVAMVRDAGANAATCLGWAPIPTIDAFIFECAQQGVDSMVDMMNIKFPFEILSKLKKLPTAVVLHRGVDEGEGGAKTIPYADITRIRGSYNILISVAGGETGREVMRAHFNGANIAVAWREFNPLSDEGRKIIAEFLRKTR